MVRISEQSIYKKVLQLESKEYIVSHKEKEGNMPDKAVYTITDKGNDYFNRLMNDIQIMMLVYIWILILLLRI